LLKESTIFLSLAAAIGLITVSALSINATASMLSLENATLNNIDFLPAL
jgi:hypothetical protein